MNVEGVVHRRYGPCVEVTVGALPLVSRFREQQEDALGGMGIGAIRGPAVGLAMLDTGSAVSLFRRDREGGLGLQSSGEMRIRGIRAVGLRERAGPGDSIPGVIGSLVVGAWRREVRFGLIDLFDDAPEIIALLGLDVLMQCRFAYDGPSARVVLDVPDAPRPNAGAQCFRGGRRPASPRDRQPSN